MTAPSAMSLLTSVRSHLAVDWDADASPPPMLKPEDRERTHSRQEHIYSEPFPDFDDESSVSDADTEKAYKIAFTAAMQEEIRNQAVDPNILVLRHVVDRKHKTLEDMKESLSHPQLRQRTRLRFIALTNMIIRLESALFSDEEQFLDSEATGNAQSIATVILAFASWVDGMMQELVETTGFVAGTLGLLAIEDVAVTTRYRRMALLVSTSAPLYFKAFIDSHLRKPRHLEQTLLSKYLDLYDEWVHNTFLHLRNTQITHEKNLDIGRLQLTRTLHAIWDVLSRAIESYAIYRDALHSIKSRFFAPVMVELSGGSQVARCFEEDKL
ncbi:hypothetical protein N7486_007640 [Penicillium sp. IBT 16267x]|nr:hypothetical protein N7486_007640 [Penicillium sp. IBT 16267x]